jgi:hypothetical protein
MSCDCGDVSSCEGVSGGLIVGVPGPRGPRGEPGRDGVDGAPGEKGDPGDPADSVELLAELTDVTPVGLAVGTAVDADAAREVLDVYSREQTVSPADQLPNESAFWWQTEPVAVDGRVYVGTCSDDMGVWVQEWTQTAEGGPYWLHRYFMDYVTDGAAAFADTIDLEDYQSDHSSAGLAVKAGKPLIAFWTGQSTEQVINWRVSDQNIDEVGPGELTFGPRYRHSYADSSRAGYTIVTVDGDDIWVCGRAGTATNYYGWSITKFGEWATETPLQYEVFDATDQFYVMPRIRNGVMRCAVSSNPGSSTDNTIWYCEINLTTGSITKADGTVLGNLDGTNLPLPKASLEVVHVSTGTGRPWAFDVGRGSTRELAFADGPNATFAANGKYKVARYGGGTWTVSEVCNIGSFLNGSYFPSITFVPGEPNTVLLARSSLLTVTDYAAPTTGIHYIEKWSTVNGTTWVKSEDVDSAAFDTTGWPTVIGASDRKLLSRAYPVRVESGDSPFEVIGTEIIDYANFYFGWDMRVRPLPLSHPVKRVPAARPIAAGLRTIGDQPSPAVGIYLRGVAGNWVQGPTASVPTTGCRLEVDVALDNWASSTQTVLLSKGTDVDNREIRLVVLGGDTKKLGLYWSDSDSVQTLLQVDVPVPVDNGERLQVAVEFKTTVPHPFNPGVFQRSVNWFYRLSDDEPWRNYWVGTITPETTIFQGSGPWEVGSRYLGKTSNASGIFYRAGVYTLGRELITEWRADVTSTVSKDVNGNTWTVQNSGQVINGPTINSMRAATILDPDNSRLVAQFDSSATTADTNHLLVRSSDTTPGFQAIGPSSAPDISVAVIPKGTGALRVFSPGNTPTLQGWGVSGVANFDLDTQGPGQVLVNGVQVEVKGHTHTAAQVVGALSWAAVPASANSAGTVGQLAYSAGFFYVCVAANTWQRTALTTW